MMSVDSHQEQPNIEQEHSEQIKRFSDYEKLSDLGAGDFGTVIKVVNKNGEIFAIKCIDMTFVSKPDKLRERETKFKYLNHPNIVKCYDFWSEDSSVRVNGKMEIRPHLYIIMELCKTNTLDDWLVKCSLHVRKREYRSIFGEILEAVEYLYSQGLVHRDLKPTNIFFGFDDKIKIADFSTVLSLEGKNHTEFVEEKKLTPRQHTNAVGTIGYMAPEVRSGNYDHRVDIYSLGVILLEMITPTHSPQERYKLFEELQKAKFPENCDATFEVEFKLFKRMLSSDPEDRPTIAAIKRTQLSRHSMGDGTDLYEELNKIFNTFSVIAGGLSVIASPIVGPIFVIMASATGSLLYLTTRTKVAFSDLDTKVAFSDLDTKVAYSDLDTN